MFKILLAYLEKNWKHLAVSVVVAIYNILVAAGVIPANDQAIISAILIALGLGTIKNSGTTDAVKKIGPMLLLFFMLAGSAQAQSPAANYNILQPYQMPGIRGLLGDTVINTGTVTDSILLEAPYNSASFVAVQTKISGTVSDTLFLQGSPDGIHWVQLNQDTAIYSNATGTTFKTWQLPGKSQKNSTGQTLNVPIMMPYLYYRVYAKGVGTMKASLKSYCSPR